MANLTTIGHIKCTKTLIRTTVWIIINAPAEVVNIMVLRNTECSIMQTLIIMIRYTGLWVSIMMMTSAHQWVHFLYFYNKQLQQKTHFLQIFVKIKWTLHLNDKTNLEFRLRFTWSLKSHSSQHIQYYLWFTVTIDRRTPWLPAFLEEWIRDISSFNI